MHPLKRHKKIKTVKRNGAMEECSCRCSEWRHCVVVRRITPLLRRIGWVMFHRRRTAGAETRRVHRARGGGGGACSGPLLCLQWSSRTRVGRAVRGRDAAWTVSADWLAISAQLISDNHVAAGRCHLATVPVASRLTHRAVCVINRRLSASRWSAYVRVSAGRRLVEEIAVTLSINQSAICWLDTETGTTQRLQHDTKKYRP